MTNLYEKLTEDTHTFFNATVHAYEHQPIRNKSVSAMDRFISQWLRTKSVPSEKIQEALKLVKASEWLGPYRYKLSEFALIEGWLTSDELVWSEKEIQTWAKDLPRLALHIITTWNMIKTGNRLLHEIQMAIYQSKQDSANRDRDTKSREIIAQVMQDKFIAHGMKPKNAAFIWSLTLELSSEVQQQLSEQKKMRIETS